MIVQVHHFFLTVTTSGKRREDFCNFIKTAIEATFLFQSNIKHRKKSRGWGTNSDDFKKVNFIIKLEN